MKLGDFFQRLILGKPKNNDFTPENLPKNRFKALWFVIKNEYIKFLKTCLLTAVFFLPLLIFGVYSGINLLNILASEYKIADLLKMVSFNLMVEVPLIMFASIGLAGGIYVARQLVGDEPVSVFRDFKKGVGYGFKQYLLIALILGIVLFFSGYYSYAFIFGSNSPMIKITCVVLLLLLQLISIIVTMYACCLSSLYNMKTFDVFKAAFIYTFKQLPKNLLIFLASVLPCLILFYIPVPLVQYIGMFFVCCFGFGYLECVWVLYTNSVFDKYINAENYPDFVRKGLYRQGEIVVDDYKISDFIKEVESEDSDDEGNDKDEKNDENHTDGEIENNLDEVETIKNNAEKTLENFDGKETKNEGKE